jgi:hypothetical protein
MSTIILSPWCRPFAVEEKEQDDQDHDDPIVGEGVSLIEEV